VKATLSTSSPSTMFSCYESGLKVMVYFRGVVERSNVLHPGSDYGPTFNVIEAIEGSAKCQKMLTKYPLHAQRQ
jgi:hypothetical protein